VAAPELMNKIYKRHQNQLLRVYGGAGMKSTWFLVIPLIFLAFVGVAEEHEDALRYTRSGEGERMSAGDAMYLFSQDLAELQSYSEAVEYLAYAQMSDEDYRRVAQTHMQKAVRKIFEMKKTYENSPIAINGYSIELPFRITIDFTVTVSEQ
jgi:hypothetical protein